MYGSRHHSLYRAMLMVLCLVAQSMSFIPLCTRNIRRNYASTTSQSKRMRTSSAPWKHAAVLKKDVDRRSLYLSSSSSSSSSSLSTSRNHSSSEILLTLPIFEAALATIVAALSLLIMMMTFTTSPAYAMSDSATISTPSSVPNEGGMITASISSILLTVASSISSPSSSSSSSSLLERGSFLGGLISGASTRVTKELVLHPVDTIKARQQAESMPNYNVNDNNITSLMYDESSISSSSSLQSMKVWGTPLTKLYDGIIPALIGGIPAGALFFGVKDAVGKELRSSYGVNKGIASIIGVIIANFPYWVIRTPSEVLKTRQQVSDQSSNTGYQVLTSVYEEKGVIGMINNVYSTYLPNLLYALPADITKFFAYEVLTDILFGRKFGGEKIAGIEGAFAGALASLIAQIVTTPLDVARTRMMIDDKSKNDNNNDNINNNDNHDNNDDNDPSSTTAMVMNKGIFNYVGYIGSTEGITALFVGLEPRIVRALLSGAIQFFTYELTQNALRS